MAEVVMRILALAALLVVPQSAPTKSGKVEDALKAVDGDKIKAHVEKLASDDFEGRAAGYPGNDKAAEYIADRLKEWGLKPCGDNGTFFQWFEFTKRNDRGPKSESGKGRTRNVVGLLGGSDPKLKSEIVVIGAHFDHVGTADQADSGRIGQASSDDKIWNGADDNASGTSTVLEIARVFCGTGLKPKRSILFMWFSAEEVGLTGSEWYSNHPIFALDATAGMINMDMVGKGAGKLDISAVATSDSWRDFIDRGAKLAGVEPKSITDRYDPDSDHASFAAKKVPTIFFFTGLHADYHKITDTAERLDYLGMAGIAKLSAAILWDLGNAKDRPMWTDPRASKRESKVGSLGVSVIEVPGESLAKFGLPKEASGLRVTSVVKETNAEAAGLERGDVILSFTGKGLPSKDPAKTLEELAKGCVTGREVSLIVVRDGKKKTLKVKWKA